MYLHEGQNFSISYNLEFSYKPIFKFYIHVPVAGFIKNCIIDNLTGLPTYFHTFIYNINYKEWQQGTTTITISFMATKSHNANGTIQQKHFTCMYGDWMDYSQDKSLLQP